MSPFPRNKKHSESPASGLASSQVTQQMQFCTNSGTQSQSHLQSPQENQQPQPVYPWSAHAPPFGQSPSPFLRNAHSLSTPATADGELFLFGGYVHSSRSPSNDLFAFSTRDFSTSFLKTRGQAPSPRYGHRAAFTNTILLVWGGITNSGDQKSQNQGKDDSFYLLNLVSRAWTRIVVNGPGPRGHYYHIMTLVSSKLFIFGGRTAGANFNDIWAIDLNCLISNPRWELYEIAPGDRKPLSRGSHVSVTTGDCIIIFGGNGGLHYFNDTWSFNISTRKWTELQCTGTVPSPRGHHAAVLVDDVMYVFGGLAPDGTHLDDLTALNLSTQRWTTFEDIGPGPCGRYGHAMSSDGRRVFVLGGALSPGARADEAKLIYVLDTKFLIYPKPDSNTVEHSEKTNQLAQKTSTGRSTHGQPQQPTFSPSDSDVYLEHCTSSFQKATLGESDHDTKGSPERLTELMVPYASSEKEVARLEHERIADLEQQLLETMAVQTERDRRIAQLTDQLAQKSTLLERAEVNAVEAKKHARMEQRELQAKLGELLLSRDQAEANAKEEKKRAGLEQRELQEKLDELLLSNDQALEQAQSSLQKATFRDAEANEQSQSICEHETVLAELLAKLEAKESELATVHSRLTDAEVGWAKSKAEADTLRAQTAAGLANTDVGQVMHKVMERMRTMEVEISALRGNDKSIESMECRNEE